MWVFEKLGVYRCHFLTPVFMETLHVGAVSSVYSFLSSARWLNQLCQNSLPLCPKLHQKCPM